MDGYYDFDFDELRSALEDYYGTAMTEGNPLAIEDLEKARSASEDELIEMAFEAGIDPQDFEI